MFLESSKKIFTVSEITFDIKRLLEEKFSFVCIRGEISNFKKQSSGHLYFSLKDKNSQISCAMFRSYTSKLTQLPKDGDEVIAFGQLSVYPPRGNYQIIITKLQFVGVGELLIKLHELKQKLKLKGYFEKENKKKLPFLPKTIGVVTSPTGSVIQDILNVLKRRYGNFHLLLNPVKVQGEGAAKEIAIAIDEFNKYNLADVLIIGRGGGSLEDLWPFNEEVVANAIFDSKIPIISAVGHETDVTIADLTSDIRAPTPSAAAEIVIAEKSSLDNQLKTYKNQIFNNIEKKISLLKNHVTFILKQPALSSSHHMLFKPNQMLDEIKNNIETSIKHLVQHKKNLNLSYYKQLRSLSPKNRLTFLKNQINGYKHNLYGSINNLLNNYKKLFDEKKISLQLQMIIKNILSNKNDKLLRIKSNILSIDPKNLLKKGYSILFSKKKNSIILSAKETYDNQEVYALLHDGKVNLKVEKKNE